MVQLPQRIEISGYDADGKHASSRHRANLAKLLVERNRQDHIVQNILAAILANPEMVSISPIWL